MSLPLLDFVNKKEEIFTEGILIKEDEHDHEEDAHEIEYDEHIWLSLNCAQDACSAIKDALCQLDPQNSKIYEENLNTYLKQLQNLDAHYRKTVENAPYRTLLFTDRFPFLYL